MNYASPAMAAVVTVSQSGAVVLGQNLHTANQRPLTPKGQPIRGDQPAINRPTSPCGL